MGSVVLVGGGIAGLTCAWRLRRAGHDVEVLEAASEPGGRMRSEVHGDYTVDFGTPFISDRSYALRTVAMALGIADQLLPIATTRHAVLRDGSLYRVDLASVFGIARTRLLSLRAKQRLAQLALGLTGRARELDPLRPELAESLDGECFAEVVGREDECMQYALAPLVTGLCAEIGEESWAAGLLALRSAFGSRKSSSLRGGMGALPGTLAQKVPVRLNCEVSRVETETEGVRVSYVCRGRTGRVVADAVVMAVPGDQVVSLCPKLTPDERGFFEQVHYERGIEVALCLASELPGLNVFRVLFPSIEGIGLRALRLEHHKRGAAPPGAGLVVATLAADATDRGWNATDAQIVDRTLAELGRTPVGRLEPTVTAVRRFASMTPRFRPGALGRLGRFQQRIDRSPRIAFAGDYLVGGTAEAALTSGMRAATEIARIALSG